MKKAKVTLNSRYGILKPITFLVDEQGEVSYDRARRLSGGMKTTGDYYPRLISNHGARRAWVVPVG